MPYPQLVSFILKQHRIWYLEPKDLMVKIPHFNRVQLGKMKIKVPIDSNPQPSSKRSRMDTTNEAQSSVPTALTQPSFLGGSVKVIVQAALQKAVFQRDQLLIERIESEIQKFVARMNQSLHQLYTLHQEQTDKIRYLREILFAHIDSQLHTHGASTSYPPPPNSFEAVDVSSPPLIPDLSPYQPSSSTFPSTSDPLSSNPNFLFSIPNPITSTPIHITLATPLAFVIPPDSFFSSFLFSSSIVGPAHFDPSSAIVPYTHPSSLSDANKNGKKALDAPDTDLD